MSIDPINIGGAANDGNGQSLRSGGQVINSNFAQLDARTAAAQTKAEQGVADAATAQAKADAAIPGSAAGSSVAQLVNGVVPASQLPSFVDDVLEFATLAAFPATGETGKIYIAINDGDSPSNPTLQYRWSGTAYVLIPSSPGSTDQVPEGSSNLYHTAARVRATPLIGLSISLGTAVVATDSVLTGIGKLQKQVSDAVIAIGSKLDKSGGTLSGALNFAPITTLASGATLNIGFATSNIINISGTTEITSFGTIASGTTRTLIFSGVLTITHNATSLILPKGQNITTAAGDVLQFTSLGGGNWRCTGKLVAADGGATGGMWVGMLLAWPLSEASIPGGSIANNGQLVNRATWPELWTLFSSQAISDAAWVADPLQRGKPSTGDGSTTFRMPDLNGKHGDGLTPAAAVLRGHGKNSAGTPGLFQLDQLQNITGSINGAQENFDASPASSGAFALGSVGSSLRPNNGTASTRGLIFDASLVARAGTETRATNATVVWLTVGATGASNPGTVDVTALATHVTAQDAVIATKQGKPFVSALQVITAGGTLDLTHGLGVVPSGVEYVLVCTAADAGYVIGDVVPGVGYSSTINANNNRGLTFYWSDAVTVGLRYGSSPNTFAVNHKTTGAITGLTNSSWNLIAKVKP